MDFKNAFKGSCFKNNVFEDLLQYLLWEKCVIEYIEHDVLIIGKGRHVKQTAGNANAIKDVSTESTEELRDTGEIEYLEKYNCTCQRQVIDEMKRVTSLLRTRSASHECLKNLPIQSIADHTKHNRWCWIHKSSWHSIDSCGQVKLIACAEKLFLMRQTEACFNCLQNGHIAKHCVENLKCAVIMVGQLCGKRPHPSSVAKQTQTKVSQRGAVHNAQGGSSTLLTNSTVRCNGLQYVTVLWDSRTDISLIRHATATRLNLIGSKTDLSKLLKSGMILLLFTERNIMSLSLI